MSNTKFPISDITILFSTMMLMTNDDRCINREDEKDAMLLTRLKLDQMNSHLSPIQRARAIKETLSLCSELKEYLNDLEKDLQSELQSLDSEDT